jgi:hypothetical protein
MMDESGHGLIEVGTDVVAGDEVHELNRLGRRKPARGVAEVDWDSQSHLKRGVITWSGTARVRHRQKEAADMAINLQRYGMRLLDWLYEKAGEEPSFEDVNQFMAENDLPEGWASVLVDDLVSRATIETIRAFGGRLDARLTALGIDFVQKVRVERADPVQRSRTLRQRMLNWLYTQESANTPPSDWSDFLSGEDGYFRADPFKLAELEREARYLTDRDLITAIKADQAGSGTVKPRLTATGIDCVMDFGGKVSDYINRNAGGRTTNNITMTSSTGNIVVASENVVQNVEAGIDTRKLLEFAGFVRQVLPTLNLATDQQTELDSSAADLHRTAEEVNPDRGRLLKLLDAVLAGLAKAAPSVVTSTAVAMGNDAVRALTGH